MAKYGYAVFELTYADGYKGEFKTQYVTKRAEVKEYYDSLKKIVDNTPFMYLPGIVWQIEHLLKTYDKYAQECGIEPGQKVGGYRKRIKCKY
jgi:hypothetical protein